MLALKRQRKIRGFACGRYWIPSPPFTEQVIFNYEPAEVDITDDSRERTLRRDVNGLSRTKGGSSARWPSENNAVRLAREFANIQICVVHAGNGVWYVTGSPHD